MRTIRERSIMYIKPELKSININEMKNIILAGACSKYGYVCIDPSLFNCAVAGFSNNCPTYDSNKCDPLAAPTAGHGNYPAGLGRVTI